MSFSAADYARYLWQLVNGTRASHERMIAEWRRRDVGPFVSPAQRLEVLDLANGRLRPQCPLLASAGHRVYGVDLANRRTRAGIDVAYHAARWLYRRTLGVPDNFADAQHLVAGSVDNLPFADASFDLVSSVAAFEHFLDVPKVVSEIRRVLRDGGLAWVCIHLFSSLSGGHNIGYSGVPTTRLPRDTRPWGHLTERHLTFSVPLNQWRRDQYLDEFSRKLEILKHYCALREGEAWLTLAVQATVRGYDRDELTAEVYVILAVKRPGVLERRS